MAAPPFDNRYSITRGDYDATIVRYPGRTQAALFDLVVEQGCRLGPFTIELQEDGRPIDLTGLATTDISIVIATAETTTLAIGSGVTLDADPTTGKFTFEMLEAATDVLTGPRIPWMCTVTLGGITRRFWEGQLAVSRKVG